MAEAREHMDRERGRGEVGPEGMEEREAMQTGMQVWCVAGNSDREAGLQTQGESGEPIVRDAAYREGERATEVHVPEADGGTVVRLDPRKVSRQHEGETEVTTARRRLRESARGNRSKRMCRDASPLQRYKRARKEEEERKQQQQLASGQEGTADSRRETENDRDLGAPEAPGEAIT